MNRFSSLFALFLCSRTLLASAHTFEIAPVKIKDGSADDGIGSVVHAVNNKLIIGAPASNNMLGRVLIYERKNHDASYELHGEYYGRSANEHFGAALAMIDDVLFVGSPFRTCYVNNAPQRKCGGVHVFHNTKGKNSTSTEWASHTINSDIMNPFNLFGSSLAAGNDILAVGAPGYNGYLGHVGIFRFYEKEDTWTKITDLSPKNNVFYGKFGVSLGMHGQFLAVGSSGDNGGGVEGSGSVHIFYTDENEMSWQLQAYLVPSNPVESGSFGYSLAMYGNVLAVGAPKAPGHRDYTGAVYLFENEENSQDDMWTQVAILIAHDGSIGDEFGCAVAMYGETIAAGACGEDGKMVDGRAWQASDGENCGDYSESCVKYQGEVTERGEAAGAVYLYSYDMVKNAAFEQWHEIRKVLPDYSDKQFYFGAALAVNGDTVIVGAPGASSVDGAYDKVGAVYELKVDWLYYKNGISSMGAVIVGIVVVAVILGVPISLYLICMMQGNVDDCCTNAVDSLSFKPDKYSAPPAASNRDVSIRSTHGLLEEGSVRSSSSEMVELPSSRTSEPKPMADWGISRPSRKNPLHR